MKMFSDQNSQLIEHLKADKAKSQNIRLGEKEVTLTEGATNIHVSDDDKVWGKNKIDK